VRLGAFATAMATAAMDGQCYGNGDGRQTTALVASFKIKNNRWRFCQSQKFREKSSQ
jgi:hypothetical protein